MKLRERYEILGLLGAGGMGSVYRARDALRNRIVALKQLHPHLAPDTSQQLLRELALQEQVRHSAVVRTYDADIDERSGTLFFTMELLEGPSLEDILQWTAKQQKHPPFSIEQVKHLLHQLVDVLDAVHQVNILHGDLKPSHVLFRLNKPIPAASLDSSESQESPNPIESWADVEACLQAPICLIDFGLARPITWSMLPTGGAGTPSVMAPEQWRSEIPLTPATDVYALGLLLYRLLTGATHAAGQLPPPSVWLSAQGYPSLSESLKSSYRKRKTTFDDAIDQVVNRALAYFPQQRYASPRALWDDFLQAITLDATQRPSEFRRQEPISKERSEAQDDLHSAKVAPHPPKTAPIPQQPKGPSEGQESDITPLHLDEQVEHFELRNRSVTREQLEQISRCHRLRHLSLCGVGLRDSALIYLGTLEHLECLQLSDNPLTGEGLQYISHAHRLRMLSLSRTQTTSHAIAYLQDFPLLEWLSLWRCPIDETGLKQLLAYKQLRTLHLSETPIGEKAMPFLLQMTHLKELALHRTQLTTAQIKQLQAHLPNCKLLS